MRLESPYPFVIPQAVWNDVHQCQMCLQEFKIETRDDLDYEDMFTLGANPPLTHRIFTVDCPLCGHVHEVATAKNTNRCE